MTELTRRGLLAAAGASLLTPLASQPARAESAPDSQPPLRTGGSRTVKIDGRYEVYVKELGKGGTVPVLTLHGGPGFNHFYLECLEDFLPAAGVHFWYYDQLGCGFSDHPQDLSLWTIDRYREEVEQVRQALGLERFVLFGHSWGGMLGMEYALKYQEHLSGLVVSNMTASCAEYVRHAEKLLAALPPASQEIIRRHRASGDFAAAEYQEVMMKQVYQRHVCRLNPWPEPVQRAFRHMNETIYNTMQGPDEFNITGNFKDWDIWGRLKDIKVPTLLLAARHDEMDPEQIRRMSTLIPNARLAICEQGSHMAMYDDQGSYFKALVPFLHEAHAGRLRA